MSSPPLQSLVRVGIDERVATIWLNRPAALNSLNPALMHQLHRAIEAAIGNPEVDGLVLAGEGKAFLVGADIDFFVRKMAANDLDGIVRFTEAGHALLATIEGSAKPVIVRVHGAAMGAGAELCLACHATVATRKATFAFPEVELGIYPGMGGTQRLPRRIGVGLAKWLIYSGKMLSGAEARDIGLVDQLVSDDELDTTCQQLARSSPSPRVHPPLSEKHQTIRQFFERWKIEQLANADTMGDIAMMRLVQRMDNFSQSALRCAEQLIDEGNALTLQNALCLEIATLRFIFATPDAQQRLANRVRTSKNNSA